MRTLLSSPCVQLSNADNTCATLVLHGEDHTLGNSFRYVLAKNPRVDFVGYSIPHPSEMKLNMRIQTKGEASGSTQCANAGMRGARKGTALAASSLTSSFLSLSVTGVPVTEVLVEATDTLSEICDHVLSTFDEAERAYRASHPEGAIAAPAGKGSKKKKGSSSTAMEE